MEMNSSVIPEIYRKGSVKNVRGRPKEDLWFFEFSDGYSIFDWGTMPDELSGKGKSLALTCVAIYSWLNRSEAWSEKANYPSFSETADIYLNWLKEKGLKAHLRGSWDDEGPFLRPLSDIGENIFLAFRPFEVIRPTWKESERLWDYSIFKKRPSSGMLPLEVIFRFGVPKGSSFTKRSSDKKYLQSLTGGRPLKEGDDGLWEYPLIEFSTKWEPEDRYLTYEEAQEIAGLSDGEFDSLCELNRLVAYQLKNLFKEANITLWDGKCEWAFSEEEGPFKGQRSFILADTLGPDELRLSFNDLPFSKEALRDLYRGSQWSLRVEKAKKDARDCGLKDWKSLYHDKKYKNPLGPRPLSRSQKETFSMIYQSLSNTLCEKLLDVKPFPKAWSLEKVGKALETKLKEGL